MVPGRARGAAAGIMLPQVVNWFAAKANSRNGGSTHLDRLLAQARARHAKQCRDVVDRRRPRPRREARNGQSAGSAQKFQALGQLAGGIAHDFNNILQTVSGAAALIERRPDNARKGPAPGANHPRGRRTVVSRSRSGCWRLRDRKSAPRSAVVEDLLNSICEVLAHTLDAAIAVRVDVAPELPPLIADRGQMETVLVNLATNARDAMPDGGMLTLSAQTPERSWQAPRIPQGWRRGLHPHHCRR